MFCLTNAAWYVYTGNNHCTCAYTQLFSFSPTTQQQLPAITASVQLYSKVTCIFSAPRLPARPILPVLGHILIILGLAMKHILHIHFQLLYLVLSLAISWMELICTYCHSKCQNTYCHSKCQNASLFGSVSISQEAQCAKIYRYYYMHNQTERCFPASSKL